MPDHSIHCFTVCVPSQRGSRSDGTDGRCSYGSYIRTLIKESWSTVTTSVKDALFAVPHSLEYIWLPLVHHFNFEIETTISSHSRMQIWMGRVRRLVAHMILCLIMTFLLPISLLRKLILTMGNFPPTWERMLLVISCIALLVDPLFFYIPFIDEKSKCIGMDKKLRAVVLALRSLTDLAFAIRIDDQIHHRAHVPSYPEYEDIAYRRLKWLSQDIIIEVLPILPIPQVIIVNIFFRMKGSGYPYKTAIGNVFLILQFIARGCQIYHFQKLFKRVGKLAKSALYFLIYVLVGHVLGAFWYFLSIQREISCWHQTCRNITGCLAINYCKDTNYSTNLTLLDEFCPINPSNATLFDFGVFLDALQSGNTGSKSFSTKYFYTLWWGIRNMSNFGTSLETSNYLWENCFTILISLAGLLLFLYLLGNVQTYILWETTKALEYKDKKIESNKNALRAWMRRNGIPKEVMTEAEKIITQKKVVEKNYDADVNLDFVFNTALADNKDIRNALRRHLCLNALRKVAIHYNSLEYILDHLEAVVYKDNSHLVRAGELNNRMFIITQGVIVCTDNTKANDAPEPLRFKKGEVYGEELLNIDVPLSNSDRDVKCETKVEAFAFRRKGLRWAIVSKKLRSMYHELAVPSHGSKDLELVKKAYKELTTTRSVKLEQQQKKIDEWLSRNSVPDDLQTLVTKHIKASDLLEKNLDAEVDVKYLFSIGLSRDIEYRIKEHICIGSLDKVPVLHDADKDVLRRICMYLKPLVLPEHRCIFYPHSPVDRMLIVVQGEITVTKMTTKLTLKPAYGTLGLINPVTERGEFDRKIKERDVIGEELLSWAFPEELLTWVVPIVSKSTSINSKPAILEKYVDCSTKVEAFALTKEDLESVVAYYRDGTDKFEQLEKDRDGVADTEGASRSTTTIEQRLDQLIQLQSDMFQQQGIIRDEMANQGRRLDQMAAFLSTLGYPAGTSPPPAA